MLCGIVVRKGIHVLCWENTGFPEAPEKHAYPGKMCVKGTPEILNQPYSESTAVNCSRGRGKKLWQVCSACFQMRGRELCLYLLNCLQQKIILTLKWHVLGWHIDHLQCVQTRLVVLPHYHSLTLLFL